MLGFVGMERIGRAPPKLTVGVDDLEAVIIVITITTIIFVTIIACDVLFP